MNKDLKIIKKKYGEEMMHFCRESFPSLLEEEGLLSELLLAHFEPNMELYKDLKENNLITVFKYYVHNCRFLREKKDFFKTEKTPQELMEAAGYNLYLCRTEEDIQSFKKYYAKGEELCTFNGGRLKRCFVFFAVKKNVDEIKREDFKYPERQDEYGTSVISIQFTRDNCHFLSIKNRYNHTVKNPDATFSNNLDNIIPGLTDSFEKYYDIKQRYKNGEFEIPNYVLANDGKYYKYNFETNNVYYCSNNVIIDHFEVKRYPKEKYIVMDNFILDLQNKKIKLYDKKLKDDFVNAFTKIKKITVNNTKNGKIIYIKPIKGEIIEIELDKDNNITSYKNNNLIEIKDAFLNNNLMLSNIELNNVNKIGSDFLRYNRTLSEVCLPNAKTIKNNFLRSNEKLKSLNLPKVEKIGHSFLYYNEILSHIYLPNAKEISFSFLENNQNLIKLILPNVKYLYGGLEENQRLQIVDLPKVRYIGLYFMVNNNSLQEFYAPMLKLISGNVLTQNTTIKKYNLSSFKKFRFNDGKCLDSHPDINVKSIMSQNRFPRKILKLGKYLHK